MLVKKFFEQHNGNTPETAKTIEWLNHKHHPNDMHRLFFSFDIYSPRGFKRKPYPKVPEGKIIEAMMKIYASKNADNIKIVRQQKLHYLRNFFKGPQVDIFFEHMHTLGIKNYTQLSTAIDRYRRFFSKLGQLTSISIDQIYKILISRGIKQESAEEIHTTLKSLNAKNGWDLFELAYENPKQTLKKNGRGSVEKLVQKAASKNLRKKNHSPQTKKRPQASKQSSPIQDFFGKQGVYQLVHNMINKYCINELSTLNFTLELLSKELSHPSAKIPYMYYQSSNKKFKKKS